MVANPPNLDAFMTALRWQESSNTYNEPNGQGAYQIIQSNWPSWAKEAGYPQYANDPNASDAPPSVQDAVARYKVIQYYYGSAAQSWEKVALDWNGGAPYPVPNPVLGSTQVYADEVMSKFSQVLSGKAPSSIKSSTNLPPYSEDPYAYGVTSEPSGVGDTVTCYWKINIPGVSSIPFLGGSFKNVCLDPILWLTLGTVGAFATFVGVSLIAVGAGRNIPGAKEAIYHTKKIATTIGKVAE